MTKDEKHMKIEKFPYGPLESNVFLVRFSEDAFIIDAGASLGFLPPFSEKVRAVFCTHGHFDHIQAVDDLKKVYECPVYVHEADMPMFLLTENTFSEPAAPKKTIPVSLKDGQVFSGKELFFSVEDEKFLLEVIHTPGHTSGSVCFFLRDFSKEKEASYLFSGDTVFEGTVGRTDLGGSMKEMMASIHKIKQFPDDTILFPGHGNETTIYREKAKNPYFT